MSTKDHEIRAAIDLGTNTCLLLVARTNPAQHSISEVLDEAAQVVRLGQSVDQTGLIHPDAADRTLKSLHQYRARLEKLEIDPRQVRCVATATARDAKNGEEFFNQVERETGLQFRTISGQDEARLAYLGALSNRPGIDPVVLDIGGGSTELIWSQRDFKSLQMGSVRFSERYLIDDPVSDEQFWKCRDAIDELLLLSSVPKEFSEKGLMGVAGTVTTLARWHAGLDQFDREQIEAVELTTGDVHRMVEELKWRTVAEKRELLGIDQGRADVILAGAMILWRTMEVLKMKRCLVSTRGVRYGLVLD